MSQANRRSNRNNNKATNPTASGTVAKPSTPVPSAQPTKPTAPAVKEANMATKKNTVVEPEVVVDAESTESTSFLTTAKDFVLENGKKLVSTPSGRKVLAGTAFLILAYWGWNRGKKVVAEDAAE